MSDLKSEISRFVALAATAPAEIASLVSEGRAAAATVTTNPVVAPFVPLLESLVVGKLTALGVPMDKVEAAGADLVRLLNSFATAAASTVATGAAAA